MTGRLTGLERIIQYYDISEGRRKGIAIGLHGGKIKALRKVSDASMKRVTQMLIRACEFRKTEEYYINHQGRLVRNTRRVAGAPDGWKYVVVWER